MGHKVGFAILGCGHIAQKHAELIAHHLGQAELIAVCDCQADKAEALGNAHQVPWFTDSAEMMRQLNDKINIINVLTPTGYHAQNIQELVHYKKHFCVEKPIALTLEDADQMIEACGKAGVHLFVVKQNRFNLPVQRLYKALQQKRLGKLIFVSAQVYWSRSQSYYDRDAWRGTYELDGGVFANQASHYIDLLQWLVGEIESVVAKGIHCRAKIEAEDTGAVLLKFRNGALGVLEATTAAPINLEGSVRLVGTQGAVEIGGYQADQLKTWQFVDAQAEEDQQVWEQCSCNPQAQYGFAHREYLHSVTQTILHSAQPAVSGQEARRSLEILTAIYESMFTGQEVFLRQQTGDRTYRVFSQSA
jgi:UDP-N-acetyl-2-amino-2-deoxyglucuronate dehydrogenase